MKVMIFWGVMALLLVAALVIGTHDRFKNLDNASDRYVD